MESPGSPDGPVELVASAVDSSICGYFTAPQQQLAVAQSSHIQVYDWQGQRPHLAAVHQCAALQPPLLLAQAPLSSLQPSTLDVVLCLSADGQVRMLSWCSNSWASCTLTTISEPACALTLASKRHMPSAGSALHSFVAYVGCNSGTIFSVALTYDPSQQSKSSSVQAGWHASCSKLHQPQTGIRRPGRGGKES